MKKISLFIGTLFLGTTLFAAGCGKKDEAKKDDKKEEKKDGMKDEKKDGMKDEKKDEKKDEGGAKTGLANCDSLIDAYAAVAKCDKMPKESRDGMQQGLDAMKKGWGDMGKMDDATKKATDDSCKTALDGLKQSMSAMGC